MITPDGVRELALSLPGAEEKSHFDQPDFRVRGKIFVTLSIDGEQSWVKVDRDEMVALSQDDPETFEAQPWGLSSWVGVAPSPCGPGRVPGAGGGGLERGGAEKVAVFEADRD